MTSNFWRSNQAKQGLNSNQKKGANHLQGGWWRWSPRNSQKKKIPRYPGRVGFLAFFFQWRCSSHPCFWNIYLHFLLECGHFFYVRKESIHGSYGGASPQNSAINRHTPRKIIMEREKGHLETVSFRFYMNFRGCILQMMGCIKVVDSCTYDVY